MPRLAATVHGLVQGVGFRYFVWTEARRLEVNGYVRNRPDGCSVEVEAEGAQTALRELLQRLHDGPHGATVECVDADWTQETGEFTGFGLRP